MLTKKVHHYIRQHSMWKPKDVILVSVSGGGFDDFTPCALSYKIDAQGDFEGRYF